LSDDKAWGFAFRIAGWLGWNKFVQAYIRGGVILAPSRFFALLLSLQLIVG
jgi:hypothetical protein